jgi:RNA polymerase sigma-70 factor (ECF subfamily)
MTEVWASGGSEPLEEELARLLPRLKGQLARSGRGVQGLEAEDLAQEVAARALRHRGRFDRARALWPWLRKLAQRVLFDQRAASARRRAREVALEAEPAARVTDGDGREEVERLLAPLSAREREVLLRFHVQEESVATIAAALALPEGTVKSCLSRARRKLAEWTETEGEVRDDG